MESLLHVHNGVLVKIPIWIKLPMSGPPRVIDGVSEEVFDTDESLGVTGSDALRRNAG
jgi:hypothetical protein